MEKPYRPDRSKEKHIVSPQNLRRLEQACFLLAVSCIFFSAVYLLDPDRYGQLLNLVTLLGACMNGCLAVRFGLMKKVVMSAILGTFSAIVSVVAVYIYFA